VLEGVETGVGGGRKRSIPIGLRKVCKGAERFLFSQE